ncbi:MAG: methyl-accepting chemotaxis protein [Desulfuromonadaceae bacterium]|jgi:methyl-accepting chemotaxis protein
METTKTSMNRKKLNLAVKKEFQRWLMFQVLLAVALSAVVAAVILYFYARHEVVGSFFDAHVKIRRVSDLLLPVVMAGSLVSLGCGMLLALFLPQKIAGPLYRIETDLKTVSEGDLTVHIRLRQKDILKDFAAGVDQTVVALRGRVQEVKTGQEQLEQALSAGQKDEIEKCIAAQKDRLNQLRT